MVAPSYVGPVCLLPKRNKEAAIKGALEFIRMILLLKLSLDNN